MDCTVEELLKVYRERDEALKQVEFFKGRVVTLQDALHLSRKEVQKFKEDAAKVGTPFDFKEDDLEQIHFNIKFAISSMQIAENMYLKVKHELLEAKEEEPVDLGDNAYKAANGPVFCMDKGWVSHLLTGFSHNINNIRSLLGCEKEHVPNSCQIFFTLDYMANKIECLRKEMLK